MDKNKNEYKFDHRGVYKKNNKKNGLHNKDLMNSRQPKTTTKKIKPIN